ncbi:MAG: SdrD B-like domain-containing protein [Candidatus Methanomethyliaceae archaeon]
MGAILILFAFLSFPGKATYDVSLAVGPSKVARPGDLVTHVFTLENTGTMADQYELTLTAPLGWIILPIPAQVALNPGDTTRIFVTVIVPERARAGKYEVVLRAVSKGDPNVWAEATGVIELLPTLAIELEAFFVDRAPPGSEARHIFHVRNAGNVIDTYRIDIRISPEWVIRISTVELQVLPGDRGAFTVTVLIPRTATPGTQYRLRIEVTSGTDSAVVQTLWVTAVVSPPPPEAVRAEIYPELPLTIYTRLSRDADPTFKFSLIGDLPGIGKLNAFRSFGLSGVTNQGMGFHMTKWGVDWGNVSVSGAFVSLSGQGLRLVKDGLRIGGTELLLTDVGKAVAGSANWETGSLRWLVISVEDASPYTANELQFMGSLSNAFSLSAIIASANNMGEEASAFRFQPTIRAQNFTGHLEIAEISSGFPKQQESIEFAWGLSFTGQEIPLETSFSTSHSVSLTTSGPPKVYTTTERSETLARLHLNQRSFLSLGLTLEEKESDDTPRTTDERSRTFTIAFNQRSERTRWLLRSSIQVAEDEVAATTFLTITLEGTASITFGETSLTAGTTVQQIWDLIAGIVSKTSSSLTLSLSLPQVWFSPRVGLSVNSEKTSLSAELAWVDIAGWNFRGNFQVVLAPESGFSAEVELTLPVLVRFFGPTYGVIRGRVFIDKNDNGVCDPGEEGVSGLLMTANGYQAITGKDGHFVFWSSLPGRYQVEIAELPLGLDPLIALPLHVDLKAGQIVELAIPLRSVTRISGIVYHDLNKNGVRDRGEPGLSGVELIVKDTGLTQRVRTDTAGSFSLEVPPGSYTVELMVASLPARFEPTTSSMMRVHVREREIVRLEFGVWQRPREVIITPVAPIARFEYSPTFPRAGEPVVFNAERSEVQAPLTIVSYTWEFRKGAMVIRAQGVKVTVVFEEAGVWVVLLTVTDSGGNTSQLQKVITVQ